MALDIFSVDGAGLQVENYIYMYHLQEFIVLPSFVDSVQENFNIQWQQTTPLGRSAPIYSFSSAGPRTVQLTFNLHRDMMFQINKDVSDAKVALGDDYVDTLIKDLQACVLPDYDGTSKAVNPPVVAVRIGDDIFIKGVITSNLGLTWSYPILSNGKYSNMSLNLTISEIDPYDARTVQQTGSYRNLNINSTLDYGNIIYTSSMYTGPTYSNGATNTLPITGVGKDVYIRRDENGNPIPVTSGNNTSTVNQPEIVYFDVIDKSSDYTWTSSNSSTTSTNLVDEYGGIVGGNRAGSNYTGGTSSNAEKSLNNSQGSTKSTSSTSTDILDEYGGIVGGNMAGSNYNGGTTNTTKTTSTTSTSSTTTPTRQILNNGVHPSRYRSGADIGNTSFSIFGNLFTSEMKGTGVLDHEEGKTISGESEEQMPF